MENNIKELRKYINQLKVVKCEATSKRHWDGLERKYDIRINTLNERVASLLQKLEDNRAEETDLGKTECFRIMSDTFIER